MPKRKADAHWEGAVKDGSGTIKLGTGAFEGPYSFKGRFEDEAGDAGTNPEELIGAALAGCFAMALSAGLTENGTPPDSIDASAEVEIRQKDGDIFIPAIHLTVKGRVPDLDEESFTKAAEAAKADCPVSRALGGVEEITLDVTFEGGSDSSDSSDSDSSDSE